MTYAVSRTSLVIAALLASASSIVACSSDDGAQEEKIASARSPLPRDTTPNVPAADRSQLTSDNTAFAFELYDTFRRDPSYAGRGIFLSPHSISTALAMTYAGARGATETEMAKALHFTLPQDRLHPAFNELDLALESRGKNAAGKDGEPFRLRITNSTWGANDTKFEAPFLDRLAVSYGAGINLVDFTKNPEAARVAINGWVEKETESRIKDLVPESKVTSDTRLVLVNAVYFNAGWATKFDKNATADAPFTKLDGATATVAMMHASADLSYTRGTGYEAVELPYDGGEMSMVIVLPDAGTFSSFEETFTAQDFRSVLDTLTPERVGIALPKFREEGAFGLKAPLQSLGMNAAFADADFSGISTTESLFIDDVLHKTFLELDESGTEAAAATAVVMTRESAAVDARTVTVDRPFLVSIVDRATKTPVFLGRVLEPKK